jgi:tetratricopeptide (TPR) repeat protein
MGDTAVLRINDIPAGDSRHRVEVTWQDGPARQVVASSFVYQVSEQDAERIRWYLEDYPEFPADPAPRLALDAETTLTDIGTGLFARVFSGLDAAGIWTQARARLGQIRVEVDTDPAEVPGLPWELVREPTGTALALAAGTFVRTHLQATVRSSLPEVGRDRLRVLLVICRPGGREDVPFRSVASRLARGGAERMEGLDLDVLRPATFVRLAEVLRAAHEAGRPYHVVHFDGHGTYLDLTDLQDEEGNEEDTRRAGGRSGVEFTPLRYGISVAGPVRDGQHGYLIFEDPASATNQQLADGPTLGRLLIATGVPVLVLNACRSAYTEAPNQPGGSEPGDTGTSQPIGDAEGSSGEGVELADVHARIRAYGSLAAEVADAGVSGVVAMRYNVYVVTAAQYVADLYAHLLAGRSLGQAATAARQALADNPTRQITSTPVALQDWAVPIVYEAAPLVLLQPETRDAPLIQLVPADGHGLGAGSAVGLPRPPDAGFFGRDETLLALDRAFDTQRLVLLHAFAGAGKSTTAAEFARWYQVTGGLDHPDHPEWGPGAVLWSSFEHHLTADRAIAIAGDYFAGVLKTAGIAWQAVTDLVQRRGIVMQLLEQIPVLWVWDNVEPVTGFPTGTPSAWTLVEQDELKELLRDLVQQTRCKVLLTSRRGENQWLGDLPARVQLPAMPMRESLQLAAAIAARRGHTLAGVDWRPLLRYAAGNPLTVTVLVGQALRENLASPGAVGAFVARLEAGEAQLEAGEDATLGRTRSLAASLSYGFARAFTDAERVRLAVLHLFRDTTNADALRFMGDPDITGDEAVPELAGLDREAAIALLDRAAGIGLLTSLGSGYYEIHPALPWYFTSLYTTSYGPPTGPAAGGATRAYARAIGLLGDYYHSQQEAGRVAQVVPVLKAEEANLRHALDLAGATGLWHAAIGCLQGLRVLYERTGRDSEWARLIAEVTPDFTDPASGGPLPGREDQWIMITEYRVSLARQARDWPTATTLQNGRIARARERAATALALPADSLTSGQRTEIRNLGSSLTELGIILGQQEDPGCLPLFREARALFERIGDRRAEAQNALNLGNTYLVVPGLRDLDEAEHWLELSLSLRSDSDQVGRASSHSQLGQLALRRFRDARAVGEAGKVPLEHLNAAFHHYQQALDLFTVGDHEHRAAAENQLGAILAYAGDTGQAMRHYQQAIKHHEGRGSIFGAGLTRYNIALLLRDAGRTGDALLYARAALDNFQRAGSSAAGDAEDARQLIASLEQRSR